jgi:hypothetical protein
MIMRERIPGRRGAALLIVLASLVLVVTASVSIARVASTAKQRAHFQTHCTLADDFLRATEAPILHWLKTKSASVVLSPEVKAPSIEVLHDRSVETGTAISIQIVAFDQCGMVSIARVHSGSLVRLALPQNIVSAIDRLELSKDEALGLDLFNRAETQGISVFPTSGGSEPQLFGDASHPGDRDSKANVEPGVSIGSCVSTHGPDSGLFNVNTTPIDILEAAMRDAGMGGIEQIRAARANGKSATAPSSAVLLRDRNRDHQRRIQLFAKSSIWSFRIDIHVGPLRRSWWAVYTQGAKGWECVQRLAITE